MNSVIKDRYDFDLSTCGRINLKEIFFPIMTKVDRDPGNRHMTVTEKNKLTLRIVKEIVKTQINPHLSQSTRDADVYPDRKPVYENRQLSDATTVAENQDVTVRMERIQNARKSENVKEVKQLGDINKTIHDTSFEDQEFQLKMHELECSRENMNTKFKEMFPLNEAQKSFPNSERYNNNGESVTQEQKQRNSDSDLAKQRNSDSDLAKQMSDSDFVEQRNKDISSLLNKNPEDVDPTAFFKQNNKINSEKMVSHDQNLVPPTYKNLAMSTLIPKENFHSSKLEKKYILINSYDRNWIADKFRYKYKVKFSYSSNEIMKIPFYENNPTVPFTKTEKHNGIKNDFGWVDRNGMFYNAYDPSRSLTTNLDSDGKMVPLGYEDIEIVVDQDASMIGTFKDIYSISIKNVTIPTDIQDNFVNSVDGQHNYNYNFNFPYILCNVDEFQDVYDGTDDTIRKAFCQLQYHDFIQTPNGRGYIILKPVQEEVKIFYPNTLSSLPTLNLSLTKPNGELLNTSEDGQAILNISVHQDYYLKITTKTYVDKNAFYKGDYMRVKNCNIYQINSTISKDSVVEFNNFINRQEGHVVYENGEPNENGYYNFFYIHGPGSFDSTQGRFVTNENVMTTLSEFNQYLIDNEFYQGNEVTPSLSDSYENGYVMNMSLQNSVSITVEMYKPDSMVMIHDKI
jgi:hypothetical protein